MRTSGGWKKSNLLGVHFLLFCKECKQTFDNWKRLKSHLKHDHLIGKSNKADKAGMEVHESLNGKTKKVRAEETTIPIPTQSTQNSKTAHGRTLRPYKVPKYLQSDSPNDSDYDQQIESSSPKSAALRRLQTETEESEEEESEEEESPPQIQKGKKRLFNSPPPPDPAAAAVRRKGVISNGNALKLQIRESVLAEDLDLDQQRPSISPLCSEEIPMNNLDSAGKGPTRKPGQKRKDIPAATSPLSRESSPEDNNIEASSPKKPKSNEGYNIPSRNIVIIGDSGSGSSESGESHHDPTQTPQVVRNKKTGKTYVARTGSSNEEVVEPNPAQIIPTTHGNFILPPNFSVVTNGNANVPQSPEQVNNVEADDVGDEDENDDDEPEPEEDYDETPVPEGHRRCPYCPRTYPFKTTRKGKSLVNKEYNEHLEIHEGIREFVCPFCVRGFLDPIQLMSHTNKEHTGLLSFECETCNKVFSTNRGLIVHQSKSYQCRVRDAIRH